MKVLPKTEILLLGLGAAGGIAAHVLTAAGRKVVALEAGESLSSKDFIKDLDEFSAGSMRNRMGDKLVNRTVPSWRPNKDTPTSAPRYAYPTMNGVGGSSVHYGAASWRYYPGDFSVRTNTVERYGEDALPDGSALADWPVSYEELEPYYDKVEYAIGVSGDSSGNPFEGARSRPFPMPPLRRKGWNEMAHGKFEELGYHPFPQPAAINSQPYGGRAACSYCGFCSQFGCWNDSKGSTLVTTIPLAVQSGYLEIRSGCRVTRILSDEDGKATGVRYVDASGEECEQPALIVILSMFVYENVRRLLLSKSERFPNGLANNHGQVGRNFMTQTYVIVNGQYDGVDVKPFNGAGAQATVIEDFYGDNFDHEGLGFIRGANIATFSEARPIGAAMGKPPHVPSWGPEYKKWLHEGARSVCGIFAQMEVLPYDANYLDVDPEKLDDFGEPSLRVTYDLYENEHRMAAFLEEKLTEMHRKMGASHVWTALRGPPTPWYAHVFGGTRMGADPETSVVNGLGFAHEVPNLAILGSSQFPSTTGRNPTQTLQALAWRTADYINENFERLCA